jgi:uncharacterized protein (TIGR03000 family)
MYSLVLMAALTSGADTPACWHRSSCHGCSGYSCGGCYGGYGCHGCHGYHGCYGGYGCYSGGGWGGCYGGWSGYGSCAGCWGGVPGPVVAPLSTPPVEKKKESRLEQPARLLVELPTDAKLYVDDTPMRTSKDRREFRTPPLQVGQTYYYILKAEIVRDGETITETKRVLVKAGDQVQANFGDMSAAIAKAKKNRTVTAQVDGTAGR